MQVVTQLLHRKLCTTICCMSDKQDARAWFTSSAGRRVTAVEMAEILGISRNATNSRLEKGLDSDDTITIARAIGINPTQALVELGKLTHSEVMDFMDSDGTLLANATVEELVYQLADEALAASDKITLGARTKALLDKRDELADRRSNASTPGVDPADYGAVADHSPDHPEEDTDFD